MLLELIIDFHAWSAARPAHEGEKIDLGSISNPDLGYAWDRPAKVGNVSLGASRLGLHAATTRR